MKWKALLLTILMGTLTSVAVVCGQDVSTLSESEQQAMSDTVQYALENNKSNQSADWVNPDTGRSGGVAPMKTFSNAQGQPCREFISTIIIGGQEQQGYGTACRQPDGTWQIVPNEPSVAQAPAPPAERNVYVYNPPPQYYYYPPDFYYPYHIYLSFGYVYRGGYLYRGSYFLDGPAFRDRYPIHIRERIFVMPNDHDRYRRLRGWWKHREDRPKRREWQDRDRGNRRWPGGR